MSKKSKFKGMTPQEEERLLGAMVEAEQIFEQMTDALLSAEPNTTGTAIILYALSKTNVCVRKMLAMVGIDAVPLMRDLEASFEENIHLDAYGA